MPVGDVYLPILFLGILAFAFAGLSVGISHITGPRRANRAKLSPYECGIEATPQAAGGGRFPIKYYLTAMLFIIFDIEIVFLYPWAIAFDRMGAFAVMEMLLFVVTVLCVYAFVWRRGGLDWD